MHTLQTLGLITQKLAEIVGILAVAVAQVQVIEIKPPEAPVAVQGGMVQVQGEKPASKELGGKSGVSKPDSLPENATQGQIRTYISQSAKFYGIPEIIALELADIESRFNPYAKNPNSSARGIYQFLRGTWKGCEGEVFNIEDNVRCAHKMISEGNIGAWTVVTTTRHNFLHQGFITCEDFRKNICDIK